MTLISKCLNNCTGLISTWTLRQGWTFSVAGGIFYSTFHELVQQIESVMGKMPQDNWRSIDQDTKQNKLSNSEIAASNKKYCLDLTKEVL